MTRVLTEQHRIDGRVVEVKRAVPREESRTKLTSATKLDRRKIFVGGLPPTVTDVEFRAYFERFGPIVDGVVMIDRDTNRCVTVCVVLWGTIPGCRCTDELPCAAHWVSPIVSYLILLHPCLTSPYAISLCRPSFRAYCSSRGFGFVTFQNEDAALAVLRDPTSHRLQERVVEVKAAEPKA